MQGLKDLFDDVGGALPRAQNLGRAGANFDSGFDPMALADYLGYMRQFGGPLANEGAYNDLMGVGREKNVNPRWFMAIMETEDHYGTDSNDRLPAYNNYGGMGIRVPGLGYPSPIYATDGGPQPYAAFHSFHDFLEDEADWIRENGTSFSGYQTADQGQGKNAAFQRILAGIPGTEAAGGGNGGGEWGDVVSVAQRFLGDVFMSNGTPWDGWCEKFQNDMDEIAGYGAHRHNTAFEHGASLNLNRGPAPAGASIFFDQSWGYAGHAAIATGVGNTAISTPIADGHNDIHYAPIVGSRGYMGWAPPGMKMGGVFATPTVVTVGDIPGRVPEVVAPQPMLKQSVKDAIMEMGNGGGGGDVIFQAGSIVQMPGEDAEMLANRVAERVRRNMQRGGKNGI
jgi:hypothetical protein